MVCNNYPSFFQRIISEAALFNKHGLEKSDASGYRSNTVLITKSTLCNNFLHKFTYTPQFCHLVIATETMIFVPSKGT